ncbi:centrosome-associated protein CEP250-like isoform X3 [Passer domesticus]|uniref:centrosome-associated protein CEP250-like isoform X3 n=1 Tax=Passer domesticus TaxID=48849 RepID=UPI0030FE9EE4
MARSRVEAQVRRARQAKEAILEDVRGLCRELLAVRALSQQQREDMAEQLRWAQEQCCKALRLWHSAQEEEKRKLMQELERQLEQQHVEAQKQLEERANLLAEVLQEEQRQKAAVIHRVYQLQRELKQSEQLRQELNEEWQNGQMSLSRQAELQEAERKMRAMEKRHQEEMKRMHKVLLQYKLAEEKQGFVQVSMVTHTDSEQVLPVHGDCSPQNGVDVGSAIEAAGAAASCQEASSLQPENWSMSSSARSSQEREKQFLKLLKNQLHLRTPPTPAKRHLWDLLRETLQQELLRKGLWLPTLPVL